MPAAPVTRYVYLGPEGTFSEQALRVVSDAPGHRPVRSVPEALEEVRAGAADAALVPLENSVGGAVGVTLDEMIDGDPLMIVREVVVPVDFVLAARPGIDLAAVRTVAAHPQASTQCRGWLRRNVPEAVVVDVLSNGAAAQAAAKGEQDAAICAPIGADGQSLVRLAERIADHPDAVTRFVLVTRPGPPPAATGDDVTSLAVYISHDRVGALLSVLTELAVRGVNLSRIESRPSGEGLGRYVFFLDCAGHVSEARLGEALQGLRRICADLRFLGSYPRHRFSGGEGAEPVVVPGLTDADYAEAARWLDGLRAGLSG